MGTPQPLRLAGEHSNESPPPFWVHRRWWTVTHWLIAVNSAIYAADLISREQLSNWGAFSASQGVLHLQIWRWITYEFLHASPEHLLFNMIALWAFGPLVESILRARSYLAFYILSGLGGTAGYVLLWRLRFLDVTADSELVGASACIFGVLTGAVYLAPHRVIRLMFWGIRLRYQTLAWILIGIAILHIAARGENAGGEAAHLGGAVAGFVLIRNMHWFSAVGLAPKRKRFWKPGDPASNFFRSDV